MGNTKSKTWIGQLFDAILPQGNKCNTEHVDEDQRMQIILYEMRIDKYGFKKSKPTK